MMFVAGALAGAVWGLLPTLLKVRLGVNEVITTLMMNYIAINVIEWLIHGPWKGKSMMGFAYTDTFVDTAWLPLIPQTQLHWPTALLGLVLAVMLTLLLYRIRLSYEIRVLGESPEAARYAGISPLRTTVAVMLIYAGAAGLAGVGEVAGIHHRLLAPTQISLGYGYTRDYRGLARPRQPIGGHLDGDAHWFYFCERRCGKSHPSYFGSSGGCYERALALVSD